MVTTNLNLSMNNPEVVQIHAKQGDSGRLYKVNIKDGAEENGILRILRPDGVEVTADALKSADITPTEPTDLVTFNALEEVPLTKLEVGLSSSQDLHGQSNPYPSGGGVNILDPSARTQYSASGLRWWESDGYTLKANQPYTFKYFQITDESCALYIRRKSDGETIAQQSLTLTYTPTEDVLVYLQAYRTNISLDEERFIFVKGTTAPTEWSPYSNICPIVPSNGVNLIDADTVWSAYRQDDGTFVNPLGTTHYSIPQSLVGKELTFSAKVKANSSSANCRVSASIGGSTKNGNLVNTTDSFTLTSLTITPTSTSDYLILNSSGPNGTYKDIQLEESASITPYVPYQGINVYQRGKNFIKPFVLTKSQNDVVFKESADGSVEITGTATGNAWLESSMTGPTHTFVLPKGDWFLSGGIANKVDVYLVYKPLGSSASTQTTAMDSGSGRTITFDEDMEVYLQMMVTTGRVTNVTIKPMLELGSTATPYEPYNGTTHSISLGRSVYGGYVDLVSGKLVVDRKLVTYNGSEGWTDYSSFQGYFRQIDDMKTGTRQDGLSNMLVCSKSDASGQKNAFWLGVNSKLMFVIGVYETMGSTSTDFRNYLSTHNLQVMYPIEPTEVDLTPTQISTLLGTNNIFGQTIREVAFEYDGVLAELPSEATEVVGRCLGDVLFTDVSSMPFTLNVIPNNQEETP